MFLKLTVRCLNYLGTEKDMQMHSISTRKDVYPKLVEVHKALKIKHFYQTHQKDITIGKCS